MGKYRTGLHDHAEHPAIGVEVHVRAADAPVVDRPPPAGQGQRAGRHQVGVIHPALQHGRPEPANETAKLEQRTGAGSSPHHAQIEHIDASGFELGADCAAGRQADDDRRCIRRRFRLGQARQHGLRAADAKPRDDVHDPAGRRPGHAAVSRGGALYKVGKLNMGMVPGCEEAQSNTA